MAKKKGTRQVVAQKNKLEDGKVRVRVLARRYSFKDSGKDRLVRRGDVVDVPAEVGEAMWRQNLAVLEQGDLPDKRSTPLPAARYVRKGAAKNAKRPKLPPGPQAADAPPRGED